MTNVFEIRVSNFSAKLASLWKLLIEGCMLASDNTIFPWGCCCRRSERQDILVSVDCLWHHFVLCERLGVDLGRLSAFPSVYCLCTDAVKKFRPPPAAGEDHRPFNALGFFATSIVLNPSKASNTDIPYRENAIHVRLESSDLA